MIASSTRIPNWDILAPELFAIFVEIKLSALNLPMLIHLRPCDGLEKHRTRVRSVGLELVLFLEAEARIRRMIFSGVADMFHGDASIEHLGLCRQDSAWSLTPPLESVHKIVLGIYKKAFTIWLHVASYTLLLVETTSNIALIQ